MKRLKFYKENDGTWFVDLPDWEGSLADLQMVYGADTMLDIFAEGEKEVMLLLSEKHFEHSDVLEFKNLAEDLGNGAYYKLENYKGININHDIWLCDVTLFVFHGHFPKQIFISVIK